MTSFYKDKTVFITGCTGFKGTWLCKLLLELDVEQIIGYSLEPPTDPSIYEFTELQKEDKFIFIKGDILNYSQLEVVILAYKPDIVIHLAAQPIVLIGYEQPRLTYETNVMGTVNLLSACVNEPSVKTILNVTTDKVYENLELDVPFKETDRLNGFDPYSNSKSCSELVTSCYYNSFLKDRTVITARAGNVIGGGDFAPHRIVVDSVESLSKMQPIEVRNPYSTRPYQFVLEAVYAYLYIIEKTFNTNKFYNYNVGPDYQNVIQTKDLADMICECWSPKNPGWINICPQTSVENVPHEAGKLTLDCTKIKEELNWKPTLNIHETVQWTVDWYSNFYADKDITDKQIKKFLKEVEKWNS